MTKYGWTPVEIAAINGHYDIVKMCRDLEAYYDQKIESMTGFTDLEVESEKGFVVQKRKKKLPGEYSLKLE